MLRWANSGVTLPVWNLKLRRQDCRAVASEIMKMFEWPVMLSGCPFQQAVSYICLWNYDFRTSGLGRKRAHSLLSRSRAYTWRRIVNGCICVAEKHESPLEVGRLTSITKANRRSEHSTTINASLLNIRFP